MPGGCAAPRCRSSRTPTAGSCICRGDSEDALDYLAPAAAALPDNALVQFHQAEAAFALERWGAARAGYQRALTAFEAGSPLPQAQAARERLAAASAPPPDATVTDPAALGGG